MDYKVYIGAIATLIAFYSYIPYFRDIIRGKTKPHAFSWLVWSLLTGVGFLAQVSDEGGAGAWATGFSSVATFAIFLVSLSRGEKDITKSDWACLFGAFVSMGLWAITDSALTSVILITIIDALGFVPTFRKSYHKPYQETMQTYALSSLKYALAIIALSNYSLVTVLYPASLVVMNILFITMLVSRRSLVQDSSDILPV